MKFQKNNRSSLFLIELIFCVLFFSMGSAVCIQAFAKAHQVCNEASDLSFASAQASSAASVLRYTDGTCESVSALFPSAQGSGYEMTVYYDSKQQPCEKKAAAYAMNISTVPDGEKRFSSITVKRSDGETIYELEIRYPAYESSGADNIKEEVKP